MESLNKLLPVYVSIVVSNGLSISEKKTKIQNIFGALQKKRAISVYACNEGPNPPTHSMSDQGLSVYAGNEYHDKPAHSHGSSGS